MQDGYLIESTPMDEAKANILLAALHTASVPASHVEPFLGAMLSLRRIAEGLDEIREGGGCEIS